MLVIETIILCSAFFALCFLGTGTDEKNLRNCMSYPEEIQKQIKEIEEYQGNIRKQADSPHESRIFYCLPFCF